MEPVRCPECGSEKLYADYKRAEILCNQCESVVADALFEQGGGGETSAMSHPPGNDNRLLPQLFYSPRDSEGRIVANDVLWKLRTTAMMQNLKSSERSTLAFEAKLRHLAQQRGIPDPILKRATDLYRQVRQKKLFNKPNLAELALGLLLTAAREAKYAISLEDLIDNSQASLNKVKRLHYRIKVALKIVCPLPSTDSFIAYYASKIGVLQNGTILREAREISKINVDVNAAAHCVAAGSLYIAIRNSGNGISQKNFCESVNLSEISLRDWVQRLGGHDSNHFVPRSVDPEELDDP